MAGTVTEYVPGERFSFTWSFLHEPEEKAPLTVTVEASASEEGARVRITHGPYPDSEESREERMGHAEGWRFFMARLRALRP
jgi:uncharacterized protein YndB with AHSA1/START domain